MVDNTNVALEAERDHRTAIETAEDYIENFDILETITNVGNDEVFTPAKVCKQILDVLPDEVWHNPNYKWLNPASKNGIFEREIALRLNDGLKDIIPNELERKKHILQNMIYSIGLTKFTSNVARRTLYYCSEANRKCDGIKADDGHYVNGYAIGNGTWFDDEEGNVKTPTSDHVFENGKKCKYCGISNESKYVSLIQKEQYAYEFIHTDNIQKLINDKFNGGKEMKIDIIIGNPPYQLSDGGAQASAKPIYHLFVEQAKRLNPKYLSMIIPSRWMTGGKGLDDFRYSMIHDKSIKQLHDYANSKECFSTVEIKGGVCYFLWEKDYNGMCECYRYSSDGLSKSIRTLHEDGCDVFIREPKLIGIYRKVQQFKETSLSNIVSAAKLYGLRAETMRNAGKFGLPEFSDVPLEDGYKVLGLIDGHNRGWKFIPSDYPIPKIDEGLNKYKVFIAEAYGCGEIGEVPSTPVLSTPGELCTETFLQIGPFDTKEEAENMISYINTKFFRALVGIKKQTQHTTQKVYQYVPMQDFSKPWSDEELYKKYNLSDDEINYIETHVQAMTDTSTVLIDGLDEGDDDE